MSNQQSDSQALPPTCYFESDQELLTALSKPFQHLARYHLYGVLKALPWIPEKFSDIQTEAIESVERSLSMPHTTMLYGLAWMQLPSGQEQNMICRHFLQRAFEEGKWKAWIGTNGKLLPMAGSNGGNGGLAWNPTEGDFILVAGSW